MKDRILAIATLVAAAAMPIAATAITIPADQGAGTIILDNWGGTLANFGGTTINALNDDPAGASLSLAGNAGNGTFIQLEFSMAGLSDLGISFATRGTSTGFDLGQWSYSTDGINFTNFGPNTARRDTTFALAGPFGTSGLDSAANAYLRYTLDGATSTSGNNRIDNLQLVSNFATSPTLLAYWNFNDFDPNPPPPPPPTPTLPQPGDVVFGLSSSNATQTLEIVRGPVQQNGGASPGSAWTATPFIQSVAFDNTDGTLHNVRGNLLGVDFGSPANGGLIYSFATNVAPAPAGQLIGNTRPGPDNIGHSGNLSQTRLAGISVSPDNSKIAVVGTDAGTVIVYDYTAGDTLGSGASLANGRQTADSSTGLNIMVPGSTQGTAWLNDNTVLAFSSIGDVYEVDANTMATTFKTNVGTPFVGSNFAALAYNPDVSPFLYALYSGIATESVTKLYIFDPANNYNLLNELDLSQSTETGREIALDANGNLFISAYGGSQSMPVGGRIGFIPDVVSNPAALTDNSVISWYRSNIQSSFNGIDIGFGEPLVGLTGDYNNDGKVDAADYVLWRKNNINGEQGYLDWRANFGAMAPGAGSGRTAGAVPEPTGAVLLLLGLAALAFHRRAA